MMEERRLLHTLPPTMVVVEIRSCNSMCLPGPRFICHAIRLCHTTGRLSHGLAAIALYSHFVFQWVLCVQLQTCPCCPVPSMLLERLMLLSRAISDLHHQLKRYNTICPPLNFLFVHIDSLHFSHACPAIGPSHTSSPQHHTASPLLLSLGTFAMYMCACYDHCRVMLSHVSLSASAKRSFVP